MNSAAGPVYELLLSVDVESAAEFDAWLDAHIEASRDIEGIDDCWQLARPSADEERVLRLCCYRFTSEEAAVELIESGAVIDSRIFAERFEGRVGLEARLLCEGPEELPVSDRGSACLNCGQHLLGQYCAACGQRSRSRLISLWELVSDAFGDLFELDSRIWQTLIPLMIRPGRLTHEYLQGRRARFMPPFRMYLVLSLIFFLVAFADPREKFGILIEPVSEVEVAGEPDVAAADTQASGSSSPGGTMGSMHNELLDELVEEELLEQHARSSTEPAESRSPGIEIATDDNGKLRCQIEQKDVEDMPAFLARRFTVERLKHVCERLTLDDGRAFVQEIIGTIPTALIVLLPVMALILKALYPLSRRFYVEHLLFFVHFHAFFFLILTLQILFTRLGSVVRLSEATVVLPVVATSLYIPAYLFVAMRTVYGQGRIVTFLKFVLLSSLYVAGFSTLLVIVVLLAAFSL